MNEYKNISVKHKHIKQITEDMKQKCSCSVLNPVWWIRVGEDLMG